MRRTLDCGCCGTAKPPQAPGVTEAELVGPSEGLTGLASLLQRSSLTQHVLQRCSSHTAALSDTTNEGMGKARIRKAGAQMDTGQEGKRIRPWTGTGAPSSAAAGWKQGKGFIQGYSNEAKRREKLPPAAASTVLPLLQTCLLLPQPRDGWVGVRGSQLCPGAATAEQDRAELS